MPAPDMMAILAQRHPDKLALVDDRPDGSIITLTYEALNREANRLAHTLRAHGIRRGDKIVWCGMNSIGVIRIIHAARKVGATAVPLNYRFSPDEAAYVVDHCDAVLVVVDAEFADLMAAIRPRIPKVRHIIVFDGSPGPQMLDGDALMKDASDAEPELEEGKAAATMIYTSGTTGKPKGALRTGLGDRRQVLEMIQLIGYQPDDVFLEYQQVFLQVGHILAVGFNFQRDFRPGRGISVFIQLINEFEHFFKSGVEHFTVH